MDAYSSFITHYIDSKEALRQAQTRPQFVRFMDNVLKDHREKYTIAELMITPVQRIPRYQLLLNVSSFLFTETSLMLIRRILGHGQKT